MSPTNPDIVSWWGTKQGERSMVGELSRQKWGNDALKAGFTLLPNHLIAINQFLSEEDRISPTEFFVLAQLISVWWHEKRYPFPSKSLISTRTGISERQVQRAISGLEKKGLIKRIKNPGMGIGNTYDLSNVAEIVKIISAQYPNAFKRPLRDT